MWSWYELSTDNFVRTKTTCVIYPTCLPNIGARKGYTSLHVASAAGQHNGLEHLFDQYLGDGIHYRPTQVITSPMVCFFGFIHFILAFALNGGSKNTRFDGWFNEGVVSQHGDNNLKACESSLTCGIVMTLLKYSF